MRADIDCDIAIIGGGPGASTLATLLLKYEPALNVQIFERERFPRDHIGESQLPQIGDVLMEMGCWDKIEAANFPIKIGATFRWGRSAELWDFEFLPLDTFKDEPRPAKFEGQRRLTAFQVDRAKYDMILLRHAADQGCHVHEETPVASVERDGDRVSGLVLKSGIRVKARYYVDASGHAGLLRRAMGIEVTVPTELKNIAIWDYWENAKWAVEIGVGGTRIQIMSQKHGWLWFIPLGPTKTSLGFVCPASHYKAMKTTPEALYAEVIKADPQISALVEDGTQRGMVETTKDWSFVSARAYGENWFLVGEALGFAGPILSAGLTLTHTGARELAYTILALERGEHHPHWLKRHFEETQQRRVRQHIRFADFWYAANGQFTDLQEHCKEIAKSSGLKLSSEEAWRWLAQGGFTNDNIGQAGLGGYDYGSMKQVTQIFTQNRAPWAINDVNVLWLALDGVEQSTTPIYANGRIEAKACYVKGEKRLVLTGCFEVLAQILARPVDIATVYRSLLEAFKAQLHPQHHNVAMRFHLQALDVMLEEGWVAGQLDPSLQRLSLETPNEGDFIHKHHDTLADAVHPAQ